MTMSTEENETSTIVLSGLLSFMNGSSVCEAGGQRAWLMTCDTMLCQHMALEWKWKWGVAYIEVPQVDVHVRVSVELALCT